MMRAISLHQPWASLMAVGAKTIETRGRVCHVRGDVAIVSTLKCPHGNPDVIAGAGRHLGKLYPKLTGIPRGFVVCVVEIWGCRTVEACHIDADERIFGDYSPGRFAWLTRHRRQLSEPVPCLGHQGFFFLPADVEAKVRAQI